jgi:hypothetical protein
MSALESLKEITDKLRNLIIRDPGNTISLPKNSSRRNMNKTVVDYINVRSQIVIPQAPKNGGGIGYELAVIAAFLIYIKVMFFNERVSNALLSQGYYMLVIKNLFPILKRLGMILTQLIKNNPTLGYATLAAMTSLSYSLKNSYTKMLKNPMAYFTNPAKLIPSSRSIATAAATGAAAGSAIPRQITNQITSQLNTMIKSINTSRALADNERRVLFKALMRFPTSGMRAVRDTIDDATFVVLALIASVLFAMSLRAGKSVVRKTLRKINGRKTLKSVTGKETLSIT